MENVEKIFEKNVIYNYNIIELLIKENVVEGNLNAKLVVFYSIDEKLLPSDQREFLFKMLGAVKHNLENTLIISDQSKITFKQIVKNNTVRHIMFFGTTRKNVGLNLNLKRYKIFNLQNINCLFIDKLEVIKEDNKRKSALWSLMKTMFSI